MGDMDQGIDLREETRRTISHLDKDIHPDTYPEARRELTICQGAFESVVRAVDNLLGQLSDYCRDDETADTKVRSEPSMPVRSPYGRELRSLSDEMGNLEARIVYRTSLLEL